METITKLDYTPFDYWKPHLEEPQDDDEDYPDNTQNKRFTHEAAK
jgi:hypothetical protein